MIVRLTLTISGKDWAQIQQRIKRKADEVFGAGAWRMEDVSLVAAQVSTRRPGATDSDAVTAYLTVVLIAS